MKYILAIDQGTTSSRSLLIDANGTVVASAQKEFCQYFPKAGWVEHDPIEIFESQMKTCEQVITQAKINVEDIVALGITNQRETIVVWNRDTGLPIHKALVWQDRRTASRCDQLIADNWQERIREKTGLPIDAYFSATKIEWIIDSISEAKECAKEGRLMVGTIDTWLIWKMTNGHSFVTDETNASRTMLYNIQERNWDADLLALFGVSEQMLPKVQASSSLFGYYEINGHSIPICGVAGDQQAALFGQGCWHKGEMKNTYGTGCFILMNQGSQFVLSDHGLITTMACSLTPEPVYALEGSIFVAGAAIQWLRDGLELVSDASETQQLAEEVPGSDEVVFVPAFVGLGTPYWDMYARGAIFGLTRDTTKAHIAKAALQSIAFQVKDVMQAMMADSGLAITQLKVDGGATDNDYLMQFQADMLGIDVLRSHNKETTALGAAYLAGVMIGLWTLDDLSSLSSEGKTFNPKMDEDYKDKIYTHWKKAIGRTLGWLKN